MYNPKLHGNVLVMQSKNNTALFDSGILQMISAVFVLCNSRKRVS